MTTSDIQDQTKRKALEKLDFWVKQTLKYVIETRDFSALSNIYPDKDYFTDDEYKEIETNLKNINSGNEQLRSYCRNRSISQIEEIDRLLNLKHNK